MSKTQNDIAKEGAAQVYALDVSLAAQACSAKIQGALRSVWPVQYGEVLEEMHTAILTFRADVQTAHEMYVKRLGDAADGD